jgi:hypothetical protein
MPGAHLGCLKAEGLGPYPTAMKLIRRSPQALEKSYLRMKYAKRTLEARMEFKKK